MSSAVSKIERITTENNKNPYQRLYLLTLAIERGDFYSLINHIEWSFIHDGIINAAVHNVFNKKDIYLEDIYTKEEFLDMTPKQRAFAIFQPIFDTKKELNIYCVSNNTDIIEEFII